MLLLHSLSGGLVCKRLFRAGEEESLSKSTGYLFLRCSLNMDLLERDDQIVDLLHTGLVVLVEDRFCRVINN